jgi:hypothetical protein
MFDIAYTLYNYLTVDYTEAEGNRELSYQRSLPIQPSCRKLPGRCEFYCDGPYAYCLELAGDAQLGKSSNISAAAAASLQYYYSKMYN